MKAYAFLFGILLLFAGIAAYLAWPQRGALRQTATISAGRDQLRYENYEVKRFMGGSRHVISVKDHGQDAWRELIDFRFDDPLDMNETNFRLAPLPAGRYALLLGWKMAISPGAGGGDWIFWDAGRDLEGWECCNYELLKDLRIDAAGHGVLTLNSIPQREGETKELKSNDGGRTWHPSTGP